MRILEFTQGITYGNLKLEQHYDGKHYYLYKIDGFKKELILVGSYEEIQEKTEELINEEDKEICACCSEKIGDVRTVDGLVCWNCHDKYYDYCFECENWKNKENMVRLNHYHTSICRDCAKNYIPCSECGTLLHSEHGLKNPEGKIMCANCYYDHFVDCWLCDAVMRKGTEFWSERYSAPVCCSCLRFSEAIRDYNYKQELIFHGEAKQGKPFLGFELEVEADDFELEKLALGVLDIWNLFNYSHIVCKRDGSLLNGFEIVSQPMTLDYIHSQKKVIRKMFKYLKDNKFYERETCGLHVHVSREFLGETEEKRIKTIGKMIYLLERFQNEVFQFSRREEDNLRWCKFRGEGIENIQDLYELYSFFRYSVINVKNEETIEIRLFAGTLDYVSFMASLQFVQVLVDVCMRYDESQLKGMSWSYFLSHGWMYDELMKYCLKKGLLNERVAI